MNPFGGNAFAGGVSPQFSSPFPPQGFAQFGNAGGFYSGSMPFQGGNVFPGGALFPPAGFPSASIGGQFGPGFGMSSVPGSGFGNRQTPFHPGQQLPFFPGQQPQFLPGQQPPFGNPNHFGSGSFGRPRSRHSSRHRSKSRRRRSSSSSSSDNERHRRGSPFGRIGVPYENLQPFQNAPPLSPRGGSPVILPRRPAW